MSNPSHSEPAEHPRTEESAPPESPPRHRSMEKTDCDLGQHPGEEIEDAAQEAGDAPGSHADEDLLADMDLLREEFLKKQNECSFLQARVVELRTEIEALRSDFSVQRDELREEIRTLNGLVEAARTDSEALDAELDSLQQANKQLKAQNLTLQYHLNLWGIPVATGEVSPESTDGPAREEEKTFFPALQPVRGGVDPIPVSLRGELSVLSFPDLLHFLANTNLRGVLTVVAEGVVSKLYLEGPVLRMVGWNSRDRDLGLLTLLTESELIPHEKSGELGEQDLFDWELARILVTEKQIPEKTVRLGLKEHARVVLGYLFQLRHGAFFFQSGQIQRMRELQFELLITDVLLKTAAEMDEKTRDLVGEALGDG